MTPRAGSLARPYGTLRYEFRDGPNPVLFLPGWRSDRQGAKALAVDAWCAAVGRGCLRLDYFAHGETGGDFEAGTIGLWLDDVLAVLDATPGAVTLCGSSMGGWLALLAARARPERVARLIGIASAPDFSHELMLPGVRDVIERDGFVDIPSQFGAPARVRKAFFEEAARHLLLGGGAIAIRCPVRLLHGQRDAEVPWRTSLRVAEVVATDDVRAVLVKDADHRLSRPSDLALLAGILAEDRS